MLRALYNYIISIAAQLSSTRKIYPCILEIVLDISICNYLCETERTWETCRQTHPNVAYSIEDRC